MPARRVLYRPSCIPTPNSTLGQDQLPETGQWSSLLTKGGNKVKQRSALLHHSCDLSFTHSLCGTRYAVGFGVKEANQRTWSFLDSIKESKIGNCLCSSESPSSRLSQQYQSRHICFRHRKLDRRHSCVGMGKPCSRPRTQHIQR